MAKLTDALKKVECYSANVNELVENLGDTITVIDENDGNPNKLIMQIEDFGTVAQILWNAIKGTMQECEGKQIEVRLPQNFTGRMVEFALNLFGFRL